MHVMVDLIMKSHLNAGGFSFSGNSEGNDGDVVACDILRPRPDFPGERGAEFVGGKGLRQDGFAAIRSELFAAPIGLQHAVGVEQEAIADSDCETLRLVTREWHDAENQAILNDVVN